MSDNLSNKVASMSTDIANIKSEITEIKSMLKEHTDSEKETWDKVMKFMTVEMSKKAGKWTETFLTWMLYSLGAIFILLAVALFVTHVGSVSNVITK